MARESKSIHVHPDLEQMLIGIHERFGWELISSHEVVSNSTHISQDQYYVYHHVKTTTYVKLVFARDTEIVNHDQIQTLEREYWECFNVFMDAPLAFPGLIYWLFAGLFYVPVLLRMAIIKDITFLSALPALLLGAAPILIRHFCYYIPKKKNADTCRSRCVDIELEIEKLVNR